MQGDDLLIPLRNQEESFSKGPSSFIVWVQEAFEKGREIGAKLLTISLF
jgi:hypothetical protein